MGCGARVSPVQFATNGPPRRLGVGFLCFEDFFNMKNAVLPAGTKMTLRSYPRRVQCACLLGDLNRNFGNSHNVEQST